MCVALTCQQFALVSNKIGQYKSNLDKKKIFEFNSIEQFGLDRKFYVSVESKSHILKGELIHDFNICNEPVYLYVKHGKGGRHRESD